MKVIVLLSGGIDSAVVLAELVKDYECEAIGFDYGQRHAIELDRAEKIANYYKVPFARRVLMIMPLVDDVVFAGRNLVMISAAISEAQARGFEAVAIGCNSSDWLRFPDCRPAFWNAVRTAAETYGVKVMTPLMYSWKDQIISHAKKIGVPVDLTWSCYSPIDGKPCGCCLACKTRGDARC